MNKKVVLGIAIVVVLGGIGFYYWQSQTREQSGLLGYSNASSSVPAQTHASSSTITSSTQPTTNPKVQLTAMSSASRANGLTTYAWRDLRFTSESSEIHDTFSVVYTQLKV